MTSYSDGPQSSLFTPIGLQGVQAAPLADQLATARVTATMMQALKHAPEGDCTGWGIPFDASAPITVSDQPARVEFVPIMARQLVFMHTSDVRAAQTNASGFIPASRGHGQLGEHAADYVIQYADGVEERVAIRRRRQVGPVDRNWGENCFEAVAMRKPHPLQASHQQQIGDWGRLQTRAFTNDAGPWTSWLWSWENPRPTQAIVGIRFEPVCGVIVISAVTAGDASSLPLRWRTRRKAVLSLPPGERFNARLDDNGLLGQIQLDLGQVISASPRAVYLNEAWGKTYNNQIPHLSEQEVLVEYTAHAEACFHLIDGAGGTRVVPAVQVEAGQADGAIQPVAPATQRVTLRVVEHGGAKAVPVKLHVHGAASEYLAPVDRHRIPNPAWFEDYSVDFAHQRAHACTYINGETTIDLPHGKVYIEVSKGFEIRPVRRVIEVTADTREITIELERVLSWRERGWVTADTHVHFLSPISALLEGSAEGVNVINLLASQWGELMTNVGDFDGHATWGAKEAGGDGEYLVRVGTENRQHVLGHISLLGYNGRIIAPMTTGGPDESALGDPIEILLSEWARQCKQQGGVVVLPHFPNPRAEHAAAVVNGDVDAVEMTSWGDLYSGIDPYSLSDWYRYLNCGYLVAAVGGTDKMSADTAVGTVRTYARIPPDAREGFTYANWMDAVRRAETFVTYGPLLDFAVDGKPMGSRIVLSASGGTVDVTWQVSSVTVPLSRVELVVNGEIRESVTVTSGDAAGHWSVRVDKSAWLALLVRGNHADKREIIAAHSSPVMITVEGSQMLAAADAVTILEQIEGSLAYIDTVGTRAEDVVYKRMRLVLQSAHRSLHNRMHAQGMFHDHTAVDDHH